MSEHATPVQSRAILIGVATYDDPAFPPIPAARNSLTGMRALLADPTLCGWPLETIVVFDDPAQPGHLARQIRELACGADDVLLLYYVGHGKITPRGELCLTVTDTAAADSDYTGLPFQWLKDALRESPARVKLVILDCCYAGQAIEALSQSDDIADLAHINGSYTLTATTRNQSAHVSPLDQQEATCTSFTRELIALTRAGIPDGPPDLTLSTIYPYLRQRLAALGLPHPNQRGTNTAERYVFATNAQHVGARPPVGEAAAWINRADTSYGQGRYSQAEAAYREAIRFDPDRASAHNGLGRVLADQERYAEAEAAYREVIRLEPTDAYAHRDLGAALRGQDRLAEAEAAYREAIRLNPKDAYAHTCLGSILKNQERYAEAEAANREGVRLNPKDAYAHTCLGDVLYCLTRWTEAEEVYREAIRLNPKGAYAHTCLGHVLENQERYAEAEVAYREGVRLDATNAFAHASLGNSLYAQGRYAEAEVAYREGVRLDATDAFAHASLGNSLYAQGRYAEAEAAYREAIRIDPDRAHAYNDLSGTLFYQKRYEEAETALREAIRIDPTQAVAYNHLSWVLFYQERYEEAEMALREAIRVDPTYAIARDNLKVLRKRRRWW